MKEPEYRKILTQKTLGCFLDVFWPLPPRHGDRLNACCCQIWTPPQCVSKHPSQDLVDGRQQQLVGWVCVVRSLPSNKYSSVPLKGWLIIRDHKGSEQITKLKKAKQDYQVFLPIEVRTNLALAVGICTNMQARKIPKIKRNLLKSSEVLLN